MSKVRAKFLVESKTEINTGSGNGFEVKLSPVTGGSPENEDFYKWTPGGSIVLSTINDKAAESLQVGKEYYVDFTPAAVEGNQTDASGDTDAAPNTQDGEGIAAAA